MSIREFHIKPETLNDSSASSVQQDWRTSMGQTKFDFDEAVRSAVSEESYLVVNVPTQRSDSESLWELLLTVTVCVGAAGAAVSLSNRLELTRFLQPQDHCVMALSCFVLCAASLPLTLFMCSRYGRFLTLIAGALIVFSIVLTSTLT